MAFNEDNIVRDHIDPSSEADLLSCASNGPQKSPSELNEGMMTDLDRINPPTHLLVGETEVPSSNTSWEHVVGNML